MLVLLARVDLEKSFTQSAVSAEGEITAEAFKKGILSLGGLAANLKPPEIQKLVGKLDTRGAGQVSLAALAKLAGLDSGKGWGKPPVVATTENTGGQPAQPAAVPPAVEAKLKKILRKAQEDGLSVAYAFKHFDKEGTGKQKGRSGVVEGPFQPDEGIPDVFARLCHGSGVRSGPTRARCLQGKVSVRSAAVQRRVDSPPHRALLPRVSIGERRGPPSGCAWLEEGREWEGEAEGELEVVRWPMHCFSHSRLHPQISWREFVSWTGEPQVPAEELLQETLIKTLIKAQDMGLSLQVGEDGTYDWSFCIKLE